LLSQKGEPLYVDKILASILKASRYKKHLEFELEPSAVGSLPAKVSVHLIKADHLLEQNQYAM
jgi:hypothetical protein